MLGLIACLGWCLNSRHKVQRHTPKRENGVYGCVHALLCVGLWHYTGSRLVHSCLCLCCQVAPVVFTQLVEVQVLVLVKAMSLQVLGALPLLPVVLQAGMPCTSVTNIHVSEYRR